MPVNAIIQTDEYGNISNLRELADYIMAEFGVEADDMGYSIRRSRFNVTPETTLIINTWGMHFYADLGTLFILNRFSLRSTPFSDIVRELRLSLQGYEQGKQAIRDAECTLFEYRTYVHNWMNDVSRSRLLTDVNSPKPLDEWMSVRKQFMRE